MSSAVELAIELEDRDDTFSDIELTFAPLDVGGDKACVEWELRATHTGPLVIDDDVQIDATGRRLTLHGVTVAEFDGDRIRGFRQYWDDAELLAEVGGSRTTDRIRDRGTTRSRRRRPGREHHMENDGAGWKLFAGIMIIIGGTFNIIDGLAGITNVSGSRHLLGRSASSRSRTTSRPTAGSS